MNWSDQSQRNYQCCGDLWEFSEHIHSGKSNKEIEKFKRIQLPKAQQKRPIIIFAWNTYVNPFKLSCLRFFLKISCVLLNWEIWGIHIFFPCRILSKWYFLPFMITSRWSAAVTFTHQFHFKVSIYSISSTNYGCVMQSLPLWNFSYFCLKNKFSFWFFVLFFLLIFSLHEN